MITVNLTDKMTLERALKKFKKEMDKDDVLTEYMEHTRFVKPSMKKHQKKTRTSHIIRKIKEEEQRNLFVFDPTQPKKF